MRIEAARGAVARAGLRGVVGVALLLGGCATTYHGGSPPPIDQLAGLTIGVSPAFAVTTALGAPRGRGAVTMTEAPAQDLWVYQAQEVQGSASHRSLLMVFVDRQSGVFNGYLWFRSGALMARKN
ncbi:MAG: hypothetical protein KGJ41_02425 [Rhodospirillales bacterium]|nr:hypothetical protein [Rhodospirillales bacterium]MDE2577163.1 hypothetical protein [Rhodospirillales bacterium]